MLLAARNLHALCSAFLDADPPWRLVTSQAVAGPQLFLVYPSEPRPRIAPAWLLTKSK